MLCFLTQVFWDRRKKEYMVNLQQRHKWKKASRDITVGDIVLVNNEDVFVLTGSLLK